MILRRTFFLVLLFIAAKTFAAPQSFVLNGKLVKPDGFPLESANVEFDIEVYSPAPESCILYKEKHVANMVGSKGVFAIPLGAGTRSGTGYENTSTIDAVFSNYQNFSGLACGLGSTYNPNLTDERNIKITFDDGSGPQTLTYMNSVKSLPFALYADKVGGKSSSELLQVNASGGYQLSQSNLETVFSNANYTKLTDLLAGTSSMYMSSSASGPLSFNNQRATNVAAPSAGTDAANKDYVDNNVGGNTVNTGVLGAGDNGKVLMWDGTQWTSSVPSADSTKLPLAGGTMSGALNMGNQDISNAKDVSVNNNLTVSGGIGVTNGINSSGDIAVLNQRDIRFGDSGSNFVAIQSPATVPTNITLTLPSTNGNSGQVLSNNGSGVLSWIDMATGDITGVSVGTGLIGGGTDGSVSIDLDTSITSTGVLTNLAVPHCLADQKLEMSLGPTYILSCVSDDAAKILGKNLPAAPTATEDGKVLKWDEGSNAFIWGATNVTSTEIVDGSIVNADINATAAIVDTKLATIATAGKVSNSATTATAANTASAIVARDASGNFSAGDVTVNTLNSTNVNATLINSETLVATGGNTASRPASPVNGYMRYNTDLKNYEAYIDGSWQIMAAGPGPAGSEDGKSLRWNNTTKQFEWFTAGVSGGSITSINSDSSNSQVLQEGTAGTDFNISTAAGVHTFNLPTSSAVNRGLLSSADWTTFNNKQNALAAGDVTSAHVLDGTLVNADINAAAAIARTKLANGTANRLVINDGSGVMSDAAAITANRALISDANGIPTQSAVTNTELGYLGGVTSAIQTQLDGKQASLGYSPVNKAGDSMSGALLLATENEMRFGDNDGVAHYVGFKAPNAVTANKIWTLPAVDGSAGQVLQTNGAGVLSWLNMASGDITAVNTNAPLSGGAASGAITLSLDYDNSTIGINGSNQLIVKPTGITATELATGAVTSAKIFDGTISNADLAASSVSDSKISDVGVDKITSGVGRYFSYQPNGSACLTGQSLSWNNASTRWECVTPTVGTITSLTGEVTAAGSGAVAATITAGAVTNAKLAADAVTSAKILDGEIVNADISASAAIVDTKLANITTAGKVANSATTATSANTASAIVARDASGNFSAGTITATAANFSGVLALNPIGTNPGDTGQLVLYELAANGTNKFTIKAPDALTADRVFILPESAGANGQVLTTDGSGNLSWAVAGGASSVNANDGSAASPAMTFASDTNTGFYLANPDVLGVTVGGVARMTVTTTEMSAVAAGGPSFTFTSTEATPAFSFSGDLDTGIYHPLADTLAISTGGTEKVRIDASGNMGIGTNNPSTKLHVSGTATATAFVGDGSGLTNIGTAAIANNAVTSAKIADGTIVANDLAADAVTSAKILDGEIVNADINASAAIARTKLASGTANRLVVNNGSGVMTDAAAITASRALASDANGIPVATAATATELGYLSGVTSAIQTQLNSKQASLGYTPVDKAGDSMSGALLLATENEMRFGDNDGVAHYVGFKAPNAVTANKIWTLPAADGTPGQLLQTNGAGVLSWSSSAAGDVTAVNTTAPLVGGATSGDISLTLNYDNTTVGINGSNQLIVKTSGITATELAANSVTTAKINNLAVTDAKINDLGVDKITSAVGQYFSYRPNGSACTTGQSLSWNNASTRWECVTPTIGTITALTGDVTASGSGSVAATVANVGGVTAANVAAGANLANAATSANTVSTIVRRDASGNFSAGTITANLSGNATTATTATTANGVAASSITSASIDDGAIMDADVNASAAIARTKLAAGTASRAVVTNASGFLTESTVTSTELGYLSGVTSAIQTQLNGKQASLAAGDITSSLILDGTITNIDINASAGIVDTKLATISTAGKVANSATTATSANTASAIVARDASGNFTAGTITANLTGTASSATNADTTDGYHLNQDVRTTASPTFASSLTFSAANPTISSSSYVVMPGGLYVSGGTAYVANTLNVRGALANDTAATLSIAGGTSGHVNISSGELQVGGFTAIDAGNGWHRTQGATGWYNQTYGGGWNMTDTTYIRSYGSKNVYVSAGAAAPAVTGTNTGAHYGVAGYSAADYGVFGQSTSATYGGVLGYTANGSYFGILGHANAYSFYGSGAFYNGGAATFTGTVTAPAFISTSDKRLKDNIQTSEGLDKVKQLRGVSWNWKADGKPEYGVIAQEVEEIFPELVVTNDKGYKAVKYTGLIAPLIESTKELDNKCSMNATELAALQIKIKKQQEEQQNLSRKVATLEEENAELRKAMLNLDKRLKDLEKKK